jgi:hypothetical protein
VLMRIGIRDGNSAAVGAIAFGAAYKMMVEEKLESRLVWLLTFVLCLIVWRYL